MGESREFVLNNFSIDKDGRITTPGMFEGERIYAPYFYEVVTNGEVGEVSVRKRLYKYEAYQIQHIDRTEFPELIGVYGVVCRYDTKQFRCLRFREEQKYVDMLAYLNVPNKWDRR